MRHTNYRLRAALWLSGLVLLLSGCSKQGIPWQEQPDTGRWYTRAQIESGRALFKEYCARCHGVRAEGARQWQRPKSNGNYPAPPLNGTAHAWHHPYPMLVKTISEGTQGEMPGWSKQLNTEQIDAVIAYFQSYWPDRAYELWLQRHQR